ncbi:hypothetical protein [Luteimonas vadosa]|uniref:Uncharacterized protein n=1 Tax=Luteimonas vadosa TaxID=1165507 RepID=A0ABP9DU81_9GAMM
MQKRLLLRPAIATVAVLLVPLVMSWLHRRRPVGDGWHWGPLDFLAMGLLLFGAGVAYEVVARKLENRSHRPWLGVAILGAVVAVWAELAVGAFSRLLEHWAG